MYDQQKRKYKDIESEELKYNAENRNKLIVNSVMRDSNAIISNLISCGYKRDNIFLLQDILKKGE